MFVKTVNLSMEGDNLPGGGGGGCTRGKCPGGCLRIHFR